jgi:hypothetical protein
MIAVPGVTFAFALDSDEQIPPYFVQDSCFEGMERN